VNAVCVCATVYVGELLSRTEYVKLPELSVDAPQASDTELALTAVTRRFVGVVGLVRSGAGHNA
jgi:hypothetical protein